MFENLFSENQLKVLKLMPTMVAKEIAEELGISVYAVEGRQQEIRRKVGLGDYGTGARTKIVLWAIWVGLIDLEEVGPLCIDALTVATNTTQGPTNVGVVAAGDSSDEL